MVACRTSEVMAQAAVLLGSRGQLVCSFRQLHILECQDVCKINVNGQVNRILEILDSLVLIAED